MFKLVKTNITQRTRSRAEIRQTGRSDIAATKGLVAVQFAYGGKPMASFNAEYSG